MLLTHGGGTATLPLVTTRRLRALDLFCGAGGAAKGLQRAGFEVIGVDINPQPRYCGQAFVQEHALSYLDNCNPALYDFVWASPPCQHYTQMLNHGLTPRTKHPDLIAKTRTLLERYGIPWVIENVAGAPLNAPVMLCGEMFKLRVIRHRFFESCLKLRVPKHPAHDPRGAIRKQGDGGYYYRVYGHETGKAEWGSAMGIDWMKSPELAQAIPPAYSEYIVRQFLETLR